MRSLLCRVGGRKLGSTYEILLSPTVLARLRQGVTSYQKDYATKAKPKSITLSSDDSLRRITQCILLK